MFINKIILHNYRIYKGENIIEFTRNINKNIYVVAGNNGYGKTTFLTSLIWCLYGKKMQDVDKIYKDMIIDYGGYNKYISKQINKLASSEGEDEFYVHISFQDFSIPSIPCNEFIIKRNYNVSRQKENLELLIDGKPNELAKEVGHEIFINDFLMPKEIAKFFFFDSEKIVSLAEIKSIEEKKNLSIAYSEVLGIKKYEDLRENLYDLKLRYKKESANHSDRAKIDFYETNISKLNEIISIQTKEIDILNSDKIEKRKLADEIQFKLIKEGQSLSLEEFNAIKKQKEAVLNQGHEIKNNLIGLAEILPFAIVVDNIKDLAKQLAREDSQNEDPLLKNLLERKITELFSQPEVKEYVNKAVTVKKRKDFYKGLKKKLKDVLVSENTDTNKDKFKILHSFSKEEYQAFNSLLNNLTHSFKTQFEKLSYDYKQNRLELNKLTRKLTDAESKESDLLISSYRNQKEEIELNIIEIDAKIIKLSIDIDSKQKEITAHTSVLSELYKKIGLEEKNKIKDEKTTELIEQLDSFLIKFKKEKKELLEGSLLKSLKILMHKKGFINKVKVEINNDFLEIELYNKYDEIVSKEELSKGEQQLYATALLKALVEESNIKFPVFIDSPLQKFDPEHSKNVISNFYPTISDQVVLCPLLEKELTETEYSFMINRVQNTYIIKNNNDNHSEFVSTNPNDLFDEYKNNVTYVHEHQNV